MASDHRLSTVNNILVPIGSQERSSKQHEQTHISLLSGTKFKRGKTRSRPFFKYNAQLNHRTQYHRILCGLTPNKISSVRNLTC